MAAVCFIRVLMIIVISLTVVLIILAVIQTQLHLRRLRSVPLRILVNGTRGKTTVTRLLACALREDGRTVLAKTTGSEAALVMPDGSVESIKRRGGANVLGEMLSLFRSAERLKADAVVIECMAVRPESQILIQSLVRPTVSIITNARIDHVDVMGDTVKSTAEVLKLSVPSSNSFYTSDICFMSDESAVLVASGKTSQERNRALCLKVLSDLGVDEAVALRGMASFVPDIGLIGPFEVDGHFIINAFAANDMQSASEALEAIGDLSDVTVIYNNRSDREFRLKYFAKVFTDNNCPSVIVVGDHVRKSVRFLSRNVLGSRITGFKGSDEQLLGLCEKTVVCMGNIKGRGEAFIRFCQENGKEV